MFTLAQQYWANVESNIYNVQPLGKSSLLFASGDILDTSTYNFPDYVWYTDARQSGMSGKHTQYGYDADVSNIIFGTHTTRNGKNVDKAEAAAGLADPADTDDIAKKYTASGSKGSDSEAFMKEVININSDGGVFYQWLEDQGIWFNKTNSEGKLSLQEIYVEMYEASAGKDGTETYSLITDANAGESAAAYKKVSVGPQTDWDALAEVPGKLQTFLGKKSTQAKELTSEALKLWQYILYYCYQTQGTTINAGDSITIGEKIDSFLRMGCLQTIREYGGNDKTEIPQVDYSVQDFTVTGSGVNLMDTMTQMVRYHDNWEDYYEAAENKFEFLPNLYSSHYLDLLICAYACAYNNDPKSEATSAWYEALTKYCTPEDNAWSAGGCSIQIVPVSISRGVVANDTSASTVYVAAQDFTQLVYGIESKGSATSDNEQTLNKAFFGNDPNFNSKSVINPDTIMTSPGNIIIDDEEDGENKASKESKVTLNGEEVYAYSGFYSRLKKCLQENAKNGTVTSYTYIDNTHGTDHFGASGTINRVFKYMFSVNNTKVTESLSKNDWGKIGGLAGTLRLSMDMSIAKNKEPINSIIATEMVGTNLAIAYQWENLYQVTAKNEDVGLMFVREDDSIQDKTRMTIDLNAKPEEDADYTVKNSNDGMVITFKTSTSAISNVLQGIKEKDVSSATLSLGTKAYIREIRVNGTPATSNELTNKKTGLLAEDEGLTLSGTGLDNGERLYEGADDMLYDYVRDDKDKLLTKENKNSWVTHADATLTRETAAKKVDAGYFQDQKTIVMDIVNGEPVNAVEEELHISFGSNFKSSTKYEIDIAYTREAALGGEYENGDKIKNAFEGMESGEIILTLQYTPSTAEYRILGYDINTGHILGKTDSKDLELAAETKEVFEKGKIKFSEQVAGSEYAIADASVASGKDKPSKLLYLSAEGITNYSDMTKKATAGTKVTQKKEGTDQTFTFTADKASSYTYLLVPIDATPDNFAMNVYYSVRDGSVVYAEKLGDEATHKFQTSVDGIDGSGYSAITSEDSLTDDYPYTCVNASGAAGLIMDLMLIESDDADAGAMTYEDLLDGIKEKTVKKIGHNLDLNKCQWSVRTASDKPVCTMLWIPVDSNENRVAVTVYYVDEADTTKILRTDKKPDGKKGTSYTTEIETEISADGMDYTITSAEGYYTETKKASKLKKYDTAKAQTSIKVTNNDGGIKLTMPSDKIDSLAIYVLMEGHEPVIRETYLSDPDAYAELKEGSITQTAAKNIFQETFEAMAGVPSTEMLYYTTGGSEFIVQLALESTREEAQRKYESLFNGADCQFRETDSLKGGTTGTSITKQFAVNNPSGEKTTSSTVPTLAEIYHLSEPVGASSHNTTFSAHSTTSKPITATWTGTITNADGGRKPSDLKNATGWDPGPSNNAYTNLCATEANSNAYAGTYGNPGSMGTERNSDFNWNVSDFNKALQQAADWAKALEDISDGDGNVIMTANSDGVTRSLHLGDAVITIKVTGVSHTASTEKQNVQSSGTWYSASTQTTNTDTYQNYMLEAHNDTRLGTTWREKYGVPGTRGGSSGCVKSCWEMAKYNARPMNTMTYIPSFSGTSSNPKVSEYDDPDKEEKDEDGKVISTTKGEHHIVYGIECSHSPVEASFQYRDPWCGAAGYNKSDAKHTMGSGGTDTSKACSVSSGSYSVHTCSHGCGSWAPLVETEAVLQDNVSYTITVTLKNTYVQADGDKYENETVSEAKKQVPNGTLPAQALCGPCCCHHMDAIKDTWTQEFEFRTMKITALKVWRLDGGYVTGMEEITDDSTETLISSGQILQNLFYNIASAPTSQSGRLRYTLQTGQDDTVRWNEYTTLTQKTVKRTALCDGLGKTQSSYNPYGNGGKGHGEDYAYGCLYTSAAYLNGEDTHKQDGELNTKHTNLVADERDRKTEEWQRFDMRRNLDVTVTVISDFLILQTTSGDESICYHEASQTVTAQENPEELIKVQWSDIYTNNPLVKKGNEAKPDPGRKLIKGSYNGSYQLVDVNAAQTKYSGTGIAAKIVTRFDNSPATTVASDGDQAYYSGTYADRDIKEDGTAINLAETKNKRTVKAGNGYVSSPGASEMRLARVTTPLLISLNNITQKVTNPNKEYVTGQSFAFFEEILAYDAEGNFQWAYATKTDPVLNKDGYTMPSIYTDGQTKINNIIVHDPVSVVSARITGSIMTQSVDQRVQTTSNSSSMNEMFETAAACPGNPAECRNRILACKFFGQQTLLNLDIDAHDSYTDAGGDAEAGETVTETEITCLIDNDRGIRLMTSDSGYFITAAEGNSYLSASGQAELPVRWDKISLSADSPLTQVSITADMMLGSTAQTGIFSTKHASLSTTAAGKLLLEYSSGDVYESSMTLSKGIKYRIELVLSNGSFSETLNFVRINGSKVLFNQTSAGRRNVSQPYLGERLIIGYDEPDTSMSAPSYLDNIMITKLPGAAEHTNVCYTDGVLTCTDPHHQKDANGDPLHYDYASTVCYQACCNDKLHQESANVEDSDGNAVLLSDYIFLDSHFSVYYDNRGDFSEAPTLHGIAQTSQVKGMGYADNMDTGKWLREKWIMFNFAVLYNRASTGAWEQHEAGEYFQLDKEGDYYEFYCLLKNGEKSEAHVEFVSEAINNTELCTPGNPVKCQDCPANNKWATNAQRFADKTAYHSAYKMYYVDIVGQIGNVIIEDTEDYRFVNLFKHAADGDEWYLRPIVKKVDNTIQKNFAAQLGGTDVRGRQVKMLLQNGTGYNTYGTLPWATGTESYVSPLEYEAGAVAMPLSADKNNISTMTGTIDNLKLGYKILWDFQTIGSYSTGQVEVKPYVYALNIKTGALTPVDIYKPVGGGKLDVVNYFGLYEEDEQTQKELLNSLSYYPLFLNWAESGRRNYTVAEQIATANVLAARQIPLYDADGNPAMIDIYHEASYYRDVPIGIAEDGSVIVTREETFVPAYTESVIAYRQLGMPSGYRSLLGSLQLISAGEAARTFTGSSKVSDEDINGGNETELMNPEGALWEYNEKGQRWHMYLGLPSNAVFVPYTDGTHYNPYTIRYNEYGNKYFIKDEITAENPDYVFILAADITAFGDVFTLNYSGYDNGTFATTDDDGNTVTWNENGEFNSLPTILAIYQGRSNEDITIRQTH